MFCCSASNSISFQSQGNEHLSKGSTSKGYLTTFRNHLVFKLFHAIGLIQYPLKISENLWFSDVFRGYRKYPGMKWVN